MKDTAIVGSLADRLRRSLSWFERDVIGIDLFDRWSEKYQGRLKSAYRASGYLFEVLEECRVLVLSEEAKRALESLTLETTSTPHCSLVRIGHLILKANDSGKSADYSIVLIEARAVKAAVEVVIAALDDIVLRGQMAAEGSTEEV